MASSGFFFFFVCNALGRSTSSAAHTDSSRLVAVVDFVVVDGLFHMNTTEGFHENISQDFSA